jgi:hypothetical protein
MTPKLGQSEIPVLLLPAMERLLSDPSLSAEQSSAIQTPLSACRNTKAICSSVYRFLIPETLPSTHDIIRFASPVGPVSGVKTMRKRLRKGSLASPIPIYADCFIILF